jgi:sulfate adenylyltransferase small subunit
MRLLVTICSFFVLFSSAAQQTNVLFIGNSYTHMNKLCKIFENLANSKGKYVFGDTLAVSGSTLQGHTLRSNTYKKIKARNWDYVFIQGFSRELNMDSATIATQTIPYAQQLIDSIKKYNLQETAGRFPSRNALQTYALLDAIEENQFDACIGGARRDEEKARAKERIFSVRDDFGQWDPKLQRPELWDILNGKVQKGHNVRVFPISNWTELDVWNYIQKYNIELPSLYFAHVRECIIHQDKLVATSKFIQPLENDIVVVEKVRYRTVGDMTCTAAVPSEAATIQDIIDDIIQTRISERGQTRLDDQLSEAAMEDRKKQGYF